MLSGVDAPVRSRPRKPIDLTRPQTLRAVLRRAGLRASRRLGQHFLIDRQVLSEIVDALQPDGMRVIEIGCGAGTLTGALGIRALAVVALDVDPACVRATQITQRHAANVRVVRADARHLDPAGLDVKSPWLVTGNLPYRLTTVLLERIVTLAERPERGVFLVQREVAVRLAAAPGDWSAATLALRSIAGVERLRDVAPDAFYPPPAVYSSVIRVVPTREANSERQAMISLARLVFQQRRKTLRHGLTHALAGDGEAAAGALERAGLDAGRRPGTLDLDEWQRLARAVVAVKPVVP